MFSLAIPGWGQLDLQHLVLDYNGTLALDGALIPGVAEQLRAIHQLGVQLHVITADTNGTVVRACQGLPVDVHVHHGDAVALDKQRLVEQLGGNHTACVGNGRNDLLMFQAGALSICVLGGEGAFCPALAACHLAVTTITDALDLFLKPHRLRASLRG